jgi:hypothetical protein
MKKVKLDLDDLEVQTFDLPETGSRPGDMVVAHDTATGEVECATGLSFCCIWNPTAGGGDETSCESCPALCGTQPNFCGTGGMCTYATWCGC